ncbi:MAG: M4 family metallopeptidase [Ilyomonas sp.]
MRKKLLIITLLMLAVSSYAQNRFNQMIQGDNGLSKRFVHIPDNQQANFDPLNARSFFGLDANSNLVLMNKEVDQIGQSHYRYYQTYKGIPIENTMYIVNTSGASLTGMSGDIIVNFDKQIQQRNTSTVLTAANAINVATALSGASQFMWEDASKEKALSEQSNSKNSYRPSVKLVWYTPGNEISNKNMVLAFKVDIYTKKPLSHADYYIDAATGKLLGKNDKIQTADAVGTANTEYSGSQTIHSTKGTTNYTLRDETRGSGIITLHGDSNSGTLDYTSSNKNWNLTGANQHAMDVHYGVEQTYDFYKAKFNRNSLDNNGYGLINYVNVNITDNAFWDGTSMNFGTRSTNGKGVTGIDVTGHELTHGVTQFTCGLQYSYESGAMNESLSDIMGKSVQFYAKPGDINWQMSNDMGWIIRNMANPNAEGQPDTYQGTYWYTGTSDNGGVHTNSGVGNYMFYLLVNGGSGTNDLGDHYSVTGIGLDKAQKIIYRSQTVYLTPLSKYSDWREACINSAADLYGASSSVVTQVKNAWFAVGLGRYCLSAGSTTFMFIKKVEFGSISYQSGNNGGYGNFTGKSTNAAKGSFIQIKLTPGYPSTVYSVFWTAYIDYNQDGDFDDANETVVATSIASSAVLSRYVYIPTTAKTGKTRMRIQMSYYGGEGPCGSLIYGEVEDYSVKITAPTARTSSDNLITGKLENATQQILVNPNPVTSSTATLHYTTKQDGIVVIKMVDLYGRYMQVNNVGYQKAGKYDYTLQKLDVLASGNYFIVVEENNVPGSKAKLVIAR